MQIPAQACLARNSTDSLAWKNSMPGAFLNTGTGQSIYPVPVLEWSLLHHLIKGIYWNYFKVNISESHRVNFKIC